MNPCNLRTNIWTDTTEDPRFHWLPILWNPPFGPSLLASPLLMTANIYRHALLDGLHIHLGYVYVLAPTLGRSHTSRRLSSRRQTSYLEHRHQFVEI